MKFKMVIVDMEVTAFKKGDIITRTFPVEVRVSMGITNMFAEKEYDYSMVGDKLKYIGIANGLIYLERDDEVVFSCYYEKFKEGWDYWKNPSEL